MAVTGHFIIYYVAQVWGPGCSVLLTAVLYASADERLADLTWTHAIGGLSLHHTMWCWLLGQLHALTSNFNKFYVIMLQIHAVNMMCGTFSSVTSDSVTQ